MFYLSPGLSQAGDFLRKFTRKPDTHHVFHSHSESDFCWALLDLSVADTPSVLRRYIIFQLLWIPPFLVAIRCAAWRLLWDMVGSGLHVIGFSEAGNICLLLFSDTGAVEFFLLNLVHPRNKPSPNIARQLQGPVMMCICWGCQGDRTIWEWLTYHLYINVINKWWFGGWFVTVLPHIIYEAVCVAEHLIILDSLDWRWIKLKELLDAYDPMISYVSCMQHSFPGLLQRHRATRR